jgi:uncharacterized protein (TIRG00374 family)
MAPEDSNRERTGQRTPTVLASREPDFRRMQWRSRLLKSRFRLLINIVTVAVTISFSYVALSGVRLGQVWHALRTSEYLLLVPAVVAFGLGVGARAMRWRSLFARDRRPVRSAVLNATLIGYLYNSILPARAGEAARVVVLTQRSPVSTVETLTTVVLERIYDVVAILVVFFVAEPWLPHVSWFGPAAVAAIVLAALIVGAVTMLAVFGDRPVRLLLRPLRRFSIFSSGRLDRTVEDITHGLSGLRHATVALEAFIWTIVAWMLSAACAYIVSVSFQLHLSFSRSEYSRGPRL